MFEMIKYRVSLKYLKKKIKWQKIYIKLDVTNIEFYL